MSFLDKLRQKYQDNKHILAINNIPQYKACNNVNGIAALQTKETWKNIPAPRGPSDRTKPGIGAFGHKLYYFGGPKEVYANNIIEFINDTWVFDTKTEQWQEIIIPEANRPPARGFYYSAADPVGGNLYVYGGLTYEGSLTFQNPQILQDFWRFDIQTQSWIQILPFNQGPGPRADGRAVVIGNKFYLFAGISELDLNQGIVIYHNDLWAYDFNANTWTQLIPDDQPGSPSKRGNFSLVAAQRKLSSHKKSNYCGCHPIKPIIQNVIALYGGENVLQEPSTLGDSWIWDEATNTWQDVTPDSVAKNIFPPRNDSSTVSLGNTIAIITGDIPGGTGGFSLPPEQCAAPFPQNPINEVWIAKIKNKNDPNQRLVWVKLSPQFSLPRLKTTTSVIVDGVIYLINGWDFICTEVVQDDVIFRTGPGQVWNNDVWTLNLGKILRQVKKHQKKQRQHHHHDQCC